MREKKKTFCPFSQLPLSSPCVLHWLCLIWSDSLSYLRSKSVARFKIKISEELYHKWLSHWLCFICSSNAIWLRDNQISRKESWRAVRLKSGSSCFWKVAVCLCNRVVLSGNRLEKITFTKYLFYFFKILNQWSLRASLGGKDAASAFWLAAKSFGFTQVCPRSAYSFLSARENTGFSCTLREFHQN